MYISENEDWIRYSKTNDWKLSNIKDCGKWISYYKETSFAKEIINKALSEDIVRYAKHTKGGSGVVCFYVSGTKIEDHYRVISFMIENNLIRLTKDLNYFDITFKFNGQSWSKEYGNYFEGLLRLSHFIDLSSGKQLENNIDVSSLKINVINKSKFLQTNQSLQPIINQIDDFLLTKFNRVLQYKNDSIDLNDKIIHLAPLGYNITQLYASVNTEQFLAKCALLIKHYFNNPSTKQQNIVSKLIRLDCMETNLLLKIFAVYNKDKNEFDNKRSTDQTIIIKFISFYNHSTLDQSIINSLSYLIYQSTITIPKSEIEDILEGI